MDEYLKQRETPVPSDTGVSETESEKVDTYVNAPEETEKPKQYTLKSARTALKRMESDLDRKTEQITELKKEISELKPQIRQMKTLIEQLEKAETERKVQDAFRMKSKHMTQSQVLVALNLVQQLGGDLENIDIVELASMIRAKASDTREEQANNDVTQTGTQDTED